MFEEFVKELRETQRTVNGELTLWHRAADAIDKLVEICNSILSKYEEATEAVVWEYSGHINEDIDELRKEIEGYKAQIKGVEEPPKEET